MRGRFFAVGVGPGDPELLTRKAERVLREADVICAPVSRPGESSHALTIVSELLDKKRQEIILQHFPMKSDRSELISYWQDAAGQIEARIATGKSVAFIAIGDPLFFATSIYLLDILRRDYPHIPLEVVPGISSIFAAAASACLPLADGTDRMVILPATAGLEKFIEALTHSETVVLLKVKSLFGDILEVIRQTGNERNILFAERIGMESGQILTDFTAISAHTPDYLSLLIVRRPCSS